MNKYNLDGLELKSKWVAPPTSVQVAMMVSGLLILAIELSFLASN